MTSLTSGFVALVSNTLLQPTIMLHLEKTLMVFLLLQNSAENCQKIRNIC